MIPALEDPNLLSEGSTPIACDEPVCLFRAQDRHMIAVLEAYANIVDNDEAVDWDVAASVRVHIALVREWQAEHGCKSPDL